MMKIAPLTSSDNEQRMQWLIYISMKRKGNETVMTAKEWKPRGGI